MREGVYEREAVAAAVQRLLDGARGGRGRALFVVGAAGLGKTTVFEWAVHTAGRDFAVAVGRGDVVEASLPFGLVAQALAALGGASAEPVAGRSDVSAERRLYAILRRVREAAVRPLLVAFDDLHWADPDSLVAVHLLCRRISALPVALLATCRPWPDAALRSAEELAAQQLAGIERLAPLSPPAARSLWQARVAGVPALAEVTEQAVTLGAGNPLLLDQLARGLRAGERLPAVDAPAVDEPARRLLLARFLATGETARRYLRAASVLGVRFRAQVAAELAGLGDTEAAGVGDGLFRAGLLADGGDGWTQFRHALVRQAIYDELTPPVRVDLHRRAFSSLLAHWVEPAEAAEHALVAHLSAPAAIATLARAGRQAMHAGAVRAACRYLQAGAQLAGDDAPAELLADLGQALLADGANEAGIAVYQRLLHHPALPTPVVLTACRQLGRAAFHIGRVEQADRWFDAAVHASDDQPQLALGALLDRVLLTWAHIGPAAGLPLAEQARRLVTQAPASLAACADAAWGLCAYLTGDPQGLPAAQAASSVLAGTSAPADVHWALDPAAVPADVAVWAERFGEAEPLFAATLRTAEQRGEPFQLFHAAFSWSDGLRRLGRLDEALALADRAVEVAELLPIAAPLALAARGLALLDLGRFPDAASVAGQLAGPAADHPWYLVRGYSQQLSATLALRHGQVEQAHAGFSQLHRQVQRWGLVDPAHIPWAADGITAAITCQQDQYARRIVDWLQRAAPLPSRWPKAATATGRAALAERAGDTDTAHAWHRQALAILDDSPLRLARAETLTAYGAFLTRHGQPAQARPPLEQALTLAEACAAGWHASQARAELRRAGGRPQHLRPSELSPQEAAVARLAQAGRTNRQIAHQLHLSVNTVETHLSNVYRKLGIHRRWQLIARNGLKSDT